MQAFDRITVYAVRKNESYHVYGPTDRDRHSSWRAVDNKCEQGPYYSETTQLDVELSYVSSRSVYSDADATHLNLTSSCRHVHRVNNCHRSVQTERRVSVRVSIATQLNSTSSGVELRRYKWALMHSRHYRKTLPPGFLKFGPLPNAYISCSTRGLLHFSVYFTDYPTIYVKVSTYLQFYLT